MDNQNSQQNVSSTEYNAQQQEGNAARKKTGRRVAMFFLFVIMVAAVAAGIYYYKATTLAQDEQTAYEILIDNEQVKDYEDYLSRFPNSEHAQEVKERLESLKTMYEQWATTLASGHQRDFELFKQNYPNSLLKRQCDLKIDSLDWVDAQSAGTMEAFDAYLDKHPEGRYSSEALILKEKVADVTATVEDKIMAEQKLSGFFRAFGSNDNEAICTYIATTMTRFLSKENATKADVTDLVARTYNEHILSCNFVMNDDMVVKKGRDAVGDPYYNVTFSVDQHINRDNEGKIFGSYTAEAKFNSQFQMTYLTMKEVSRRNNNNTNN